MTRQLDDPQNPLRPTLETDGNGVPTLSSPGSSAMAKVWTTATLEPEEVLATVAEIEAAYGDQMRHGGSGEGFADREAFERWLMARWWPRLRLLPAAELLGC